MDAVCILAHEEAVRIDADRMAQLFIELGGEGAEGVICRSMEELAMRLNRAKAAYQECDFKGVRKAARSMVGISEQIGLNSLARVAGDVANCADVGDPISLAATMGRLDRIADRGLTAVWDLPELSV